jgi:hypothetical protein
MTTDELRDLLASLTEGCGPGPWRGVEDGNKAAFGWWLENPAGDSSYPSLNDVGTMLGALPGLLDCAEALRYHNQTPTGRTRKCLSGCIACDALTRLDGAS